MVIPNTREEHISPVKASTRSTENTLIARALAPTLIVHIRHLTKTAEDEKWIVNYEQGAALLPENVKHGAKLPSVLRGKPKKRGRIPSRLSMMIMKWFSNEADPRPQSFGTGDAPDDTTLTSRRMCLMIV